MSGHRDPSASNGAWLGDRHLMATYGLDLWELLSSMCPTAAAAS